jgi:hypothetical protein
MLGRQSGGNMAETGQDDCMGQVDPPLGSIWVKRKLDPIILATSKPRSHRGNPTQIDEPNPKNFREAPTRKGEETETLNDNYEDLNDSEKRLAVS